MGSIGDEGGVVSVRDRLRLAGELRCLTQGAATPQEHGPGHAVVGAAVQRGDEGDDAFGEGGSGGGQDGANGKRTDLELDSEPFNGVDEPLAGEADRRCACEQQYDMEHGGVSLLSRRRGMDAVRGSRHLNPRQT
jgi:hypothetical protein